MPVRPPTSTVSSSAPAAGLHAEATSTPKLLFNSSAVGDNTNPPFQVKTATASALRWSSWVEGTPSSYDAELVAAAGLDKLRSTGDSPTEQVEMELTLAGSQVTDYAWYSAQFAPPAAAVAEARAEGACSNECGVLLTNSRCLYVKKQIRKKLKHYTTQIHNEPEQNEIYIKNK